VITRLPVVAVILIVLAVWRPVQAAVFQCPAGDDACLVAAINIANSTAEEHGGDAEAI
jgi:hypothetical protein